MLSIELRYKILFEVYMKHQLSVAD